MIRIALRLDDPSETSDQEIESGIVSALDACGLCATFAVIPFRESNGERVVLSTKRASPLIDAHRRGLIEVALHGNTHINRAEGAKKSEFSGMPVPEQLRLIQEGAQHLGKVFDVRIGGFVPPWNGYDLNTLTALQQGGFDYISADWRMPVGYAGNLPILPLTCHVSQIREAVEEARRISFLSPVIIAMIHHYDFEESGSANSKFDMKHFEELLAWASQQPHLSSVRLMDVAKNINGSILWKQARLRDNRLIKRMLPALSFISMLGGRQALDCINDNMRQVR
ncbi:hypothetical protein ANAEL_02341 [Anaerolineales bacterium]|nr:hypothetical protein ANAEL_02341 [Anaerolineales bacterium]